MSTRYTLIVQLLQSGPLTGCSVVEPRPIVKSTSATSLEHFHVILRNYQKLWTKLLNNKLKQYLLYEDGFA